jgi:hypothetical protein
VTRNEKKNEIKTARKKCEATLNISNNIPGMVIAEKNNKKENNFLPKMSWIRGLR